MKGYLMVRSATDQQFTRYPIQLPVVYQITNGLSHTFQVGWTRNLSEEGACLQLAERLEPRTCLSLHLKTHARTLVTKARVVWAKKAEVGPILHGVTFSYLAPHVRQSLCDLIHMNGQVRLGGVRIPLDLAVSCRCKGQARPPLSGRTGNVSRGGLLLHQPQSLPSGTELVVTLHTSRGPQTLEGKIVWADHKRHPRGELIRHGLQFTAVGFDLELAMARLLVTLPAESQAAPLSEEVLSPR